MPIRLGEYGHMTRFLPRGLAWCRLMACECILGWFGAACGVARPTRVLDRVKLLFPALRFSRQRVPCTVPHMRVLCANFACQSSICSDSGRSGMPPKQAPRECQVLPNIGRAEWWVMCAARWLVEAYATNVQLAVACRRLAGRAGCRCQAKREPSDVVQ